MHTSGRWALAAIGCSWILLGVGGCGPDDSAEKVYVGTGGAAGSEPGSGGVATGGSGPSGGSGGTTGGVGTGGVGPGGVGPGGVGPGGAATGGEASGGVGGVGTGGVGTGGVGTGGVGTGGVGTGGVGTGGVGTGGVGTGGVGTGGVGTGGVGTGGVGTGGVTGLTLVTPIARSGPTRYVLEFQGTYFEAIPAGGRITAFGPSSAVNLLGGSGTNTGSTLWTSPQTGWDADAQSDWPPPAAFDDDSYTVSVVGNTIRMVGPTAAIGGGNVRLVKEYTPDLVNGAVDVSYTVEALSGGMTLAAWEVSRVDSGGITFFPAGSVSSTTGGLATTTSGGAIWFNQANPAHAETGGKLFGECTGGWIAHTDGTYLFLKQWADVAPSAQVSGEGEIEIYDGGTYVEVEVQGPRTTLSAGQSTTFDVRWTVVPLGFTNPTVGDSRLTALVATLLE